MVSASPTRAERTSQARQTFFASRVDPPFSGKKDSGSVWAQSARSCQPSSSSSSSSAMPSPIKSSKSSLIWRASSAPLGVPVVLPLPERRNDTSEITVAPLWPSQAELWYWVEDSLPGTKPPPKVHISRQPGHSTGVGATIRRIPGTRHAAGAGRPLGRPPDRLLDHGDAWGGGPVARVPGCLPGDLRIET